MKGITLRNLLGDRQRLTFTYSESQTSSFFEELIDRYKEYSFCGCGIETASLPIETTGMCVIVIERSDVIIPRPMDIREVQATFCAAVGIREIQFENRLYLMSPYATEKINAEMISHLADRQVKVSRRKQNVNRFYSAKAGERLVFVCLTPEPIAGVSPQA